MFTAKEYRISQQLSALKSPDFNQMMPHFNSAPLVADSAFEGKPYSNFRVDEFFKLTPSYWNIPYTTENPCLKNSQNAPPCVLGVSDKLIDTPCSPHEKKFLIFDQSGNHTRLFFGPSFSPQNKIISSEIPASTQKVESQFFSYPMVEEKWDENDLNDGEGEMLENTEEIDALLYSDSDDDHHHDHDEYGHDEYDDDEVTSTGHIPFGIEEGSSQKRQRLLDGRYKKSSLASYESPVKRADISCNDEDDSESSYVGDRNFYDDIGLSKGDKKVKIRKMLKMLETLIPESRNNKDPVAIIEKAIVYLETMRKEAVAFGLTEPESKSFTYA